MLRLDRSFRCRRGGVSVRDCHSNLFSVNSYQLSSDPSGSAVAPLGGTPLLGSIPWLRETERGLPARPRCLTSFSVISFFGER